MKPSFMKSFWLFAILGTLAAIIISCSITVPGPGPCPLTLNCCNGSSPCPLPRFLIVTALNQVLTFSVNMSTGVPSLLGSVAGPSPSGGAVAAGGFIYLSDFAGNMVDGFASNGGNLAPIPGSPFSGVNGPGGFASDGAHLFVSNFIGNSVSAYNIGVNGALSAIQGSPFAAASGPKAAAFDFTHFLYVSNFTDAMGGISAYSVDRSTGVLTPVSGSAFATKPNAGPAGMVAITGNGTSFLFVALTNDNSVAAFSIDRSSGALTPVPGSPFATGSGPVDLAEGSGFLYTANGNDNTVSGFTIAGNGALTPIQGSPFPAGGAPSHLLLSFPYLYVTNSASNNISGFSIDFSGAGAFTPLPGSPFSAGMQPAAIALGF